ncbi:hypothetical protein EU527_11415 [Candidatus Thorarchaeota archaeon]|nr:MAG: hypothetical protein EU527_11415 [Candidatus Thorarchaeota archaeon]
MAAKDNNAAIEELLEKVESIAEELVSIKEELSVLSEIKENFESITSELSAIKESTELDEVNKRFDEITTLIDEIKGSIGSEDVNKKLDDLSDTVANVQESVKEIADAKETEVIIKKIDDILISLSESDVVAKKLDDLQGYIAGLSSIEEKVQDLSNQFDETNEIVGIIVRQLDDIERKYNQSIDKISDTAEMVTKIMESASYIDTSSDRKTTEKKPAKTTDDEDESKVQPVSKTNLPSTIDALMTRLVGLVNPQTEASEMAEALEDVRDQLTTMIKGHTPVLFQFGKRARDLKSYPPTATLNENDIATLNKEIKSWSSKLKEIAKSS